MTEYLVLRKHPSTETNLWEELPGTFTGSPRKACRAAADETAGQYVAVPKRSWKPLPVKVDKRTVVTVG